MRYLALFLMLFSLSAFTMGCTKPADKPVEPVAPVETTDNGDVVDEGDKKADAPADTEGEKKADEPAVTPPATP